MGGRSHKLRQKGGMLNFQQLSDSLTNEKENESRSIFEADFVVVVVVVVVVVAAKKRSEIKEILKWMG